MIASRIALALVAFVGTTFGQTAYLTVRTDLDCRLTVDGESKGVLQTGDGLRVNLPLGEHRVEAAPVAGGPRWEDTVTLSEQPDGQLLTIPLQAVVTFAEAQKLGYWVDPNTRLMWAASDNASAVSYGQAVYYCKTLTQGGHSDWTLPAIDDLQKLFGGPANASGFHIASPIKLTGWEWSSSAGKESGEEWALDFGDGGRASVVMGDSGLNRALCVRR